MKKIDRRRHFIITRPSVGEFEETGSSTHNFYQIRTSLMHSIFLWTKKEIGFLSIVSFNRRNDFILQNLYNVLWQEPGTSHFAKKACDSVHPSFMDCAPQFTWCSSKWIDTKAGICRRQLEGKFHIEMKKFSWLIILNGVYNLKKKIFWNLREKKMAVLSTTKFWIIQLFQSIAFDDVSSRRRTRINDKVAPIRILFEI